MEHELWGTLSVMDHKRRRALIAEALLFERLVVPVPVPGDDRDWDRWERLGRDPSRQRKLLDIMGPTVVTEVPWTKELRAQFPQSADSSATGAPRASLRNQVATTVETDAFWLGMARPAPVTKREGGQDPNDYSHYLDRRILADHQSRELDNALTALVPDQDSKVTVVVAYGSYREFAADRGALSDDLSAGDPTLILSWPFVVPSDSDRTDDDLLRQAVDLHQEHEAAAWRRAVLDWRLNVERHGESNDQALAEMEEMLRGYRKAARRASIPTRARWAFGVVAAASGLAATAFPPAVLATGLAGLGAAIFAVKDRPIPTELQAAAIFHEARLRFG